MTLPSPTLAVDELRTLPGATELAVQLREFALETARAERESGQNGLLRRENAALPAAETPFGDLNQVLARGPESDSERLLLGGLLAIGVAETGSVETHLADLLWLASHGHANAWPYLQAAVGANSNFWPGLGPLIRAPREAGLGPAEALVAVAALAGAARSGSESARHLAAELAPRITEPTLAELLTAATEPGIRKNASLNGEVEPAPRHAFWTVVLGLTGILALLHLVRAVGRLALAYKRPAVVRLGPRGLELQHKTQLLGRTLRDRETLVPLAGLARITREVKYSRAGLYAGLLALTLGTLVGVGIFVDGVRVPGLSPSLIGLGLLLMLLGVLVDFALSSLSDSVRGRCSLLVVPRKGKTVRIGALDPRSADAMLRELSEQLAPEVVPPQVVPPQVLPPETSA